MASITDNPNGTVEPGKSASPAQAAIADRAVHRSVVDRAATDLMLVRKVGSGAINGQTAANAKHENAAPTDRECRALPAPTILLDCTASPRTPFKS
jgi:hypothetical protein